MREVVQQLSPKNLTIKETILSLGMASFFVLVSDIESISLQKKKEIQEIKYQDS